MSYSKIIVVGNLGREPEMRYTQEGKAVTNFSVASTRVYPDAAGQQKKETTWYKISVWGKTAETCNQYLKKGSKVLVEGRLSVDPATGGPRIYKKQDGTFGAGFEITALEVRFLDKKGEGEDADHTSGNGSAAVAGAISDDDIPF